MAQLAALNGEDELAPLPSNQDLFGEKMEALKDEYQRWLYKKMILAKSF